MANPINQKHDYSFGILPWFRLYSEMVDDEKIRLLAFEDRWHYIALLCCKCKGLLDKPENELDLMRRKIAVKLGLDIKSLMEAMRRLEEVGLIDGENWQPVAWEKRQFSSDRDPTRNLRKARYRDKKREGNALGTDAERLQELELNEDLRLKTLLTSSSRVCDISDVDTVNSSNISVLAESAKSDFSAARTLDDFVLDGSPAAEVSKKAFAWAVAAIYHEVLPELRKVIAMPDKRIRAIIQRRDKKPGIGPDLENWRAYFTLVREDDWTMGRIVGNRGTRFKASLDYLLYENTFIKISELYS